MIIIRVFFLLMVTLVLQLEDVIGCDCDNVVPKFCNLKENNKANLVFSGKIIEEIIYNNNELSSALTVVVIKKYKEEYKISDTVILYGGPSSICYSTLRHFTSGDTIILAMNAHYIDTALVKKSIGIEFIKPQFSQIFPNICASKNLKIKNNKVTGSVISSNYTSHTLENFENYFFTSCDIPQIIEPIIINCSPENVNLFPNPVIGRDQIVLFSLKDHLSLDQIRIFSSEGRLVQNYLIERSKFFYIPKNIFSPGIYMIEIFCDNQRIIKRLIIPN